MLRNFLIFTLLFGLTFAVYSTDDDILFHIDETPVKVSEFEYIYNKNNFDNKADYSEKSLREYLKLYVNFRLKVKEAESLGLDQDPKLQSELNVYQEQLYNSFFDKKVLGELVDEAAERSLFDVSINHIYIPVKPGATQEELFKAKQKIQLAYEALESGKSFAEVAKTYSEDKFSANNGGRLGYFTSMQISFYPLENVAYETSVGEYSMPVETAIGYHIVKVNDKRPANGMVKVAIIKLNKSDIEAQNASAEAKINMYYNELKEGADFATLAKEKSEDPNTKNKGGEMDYFPIAQFDPVFEEEAFNLETKGELSEPFETEKAWYILKLIDKKAPFKEDNYKDKLSEQIKKSDRYLMKRKSHIDEVLSKYDFVLKQPAFNNFKEKARLQLENNQFSFNIPNPEPIFQIADKVYTDADFGKFINDNHLRYRRLGNDEKLFKLFDDFLEEKTIKFHILAYADENPEYGALLREYRDGILLFDLMEKKVWSKAVEDSVGLKAYFDENRSKFKSKEKASIKKYNVRSEKEAKLLAKILKADPQLRNEKYLKKLEKKNITSAYEQLGLERENDLSKKLSWKKNGITTLKEDKLYAVYIIDEIFPPQERSFEEAKGFAIAGYQDVLEKRWLKELSEKYTVKINEAVLKALAK